MFVILCFIAATISTVPVYASNYTHIVMTSDKICSTPNQTDICPTQQDIASYFPQPEVKPGIKSYFAGIDFNPLRLQCIQNYACDFFTMPQGNKTFQIFWNTISEADAVYADHHIIFTNDLKQIDLTTEIGNQSINFTNTKLNLQAKLKATIQEIGTLRIEQVLNQQDHKITLQHLEANFTLYSNQYQNILTNETNTNLFFTPTNLYIDEHCQEFRLADKHFEIIQHLLFFIESNCKDYSLLYPIYNFTTIDFTPSPFNLNNSAKWTEQQYWQNLDCKTIGCQ